MKNAIMNGTETRATGRALKVMTKKAGSGRIQRTVTHTGILPRIGTIVATLSGVLFVAFSDEAEDHPGCANERHSGYGRTHVSPMLGLDDDACFVKFLIANSVLLFFLQLI